MPVAHEASNLRSMWRIQSEHLEAARSLGLAPSPLQPAPWFGEEVWLKREDLQPTGSFKIRGALTRLARLEAGTQVVAASAGNHGLGLAEAGQQLGMRVVVFVGETIPDVKREGMESRGAELRTVRGSYDEVEASAKAWARERALEFVSPFDDPWVAAGNGASLAYECVAELGAVRRFVLPVGGGGLLAGVAAASPESELVGVESDVSDAMAQSVSSGETHWTLTPKGPTLAEGLEGGVSESTHRAAERALAKLVSVRESSIASAMLNARDVLGAAIEGSAAAAWAWARESDVGPGPTVVVVSGGNVDAAVLRRLEATTA